MFQTSFSSIEGKAESGRIGITSNYLKLNTNFNKHVVNSSPDTSLEHPQKTFPWFLKGGVPEDQKCPLVAEHKMDSKPTKARKDSTSKSFCNVHDIQALGGLTPISHKNLCPNKSVSL